MLNKTKLVFSLLVCSAFSPVLAQQAEPQKTEKTATAAPDLV